MVAALSSMSFGEFALAVAAAAGLSMLVYWHASRHGSAHATAWGIGAFLLAGVFVPLYFVWHWASRRGR